MKLLPLKLKLYIYTLFAVTPFALALFITSSYIPANENVVMQQIAIFVILAAITESLSTAFKTVTFSFSFAVTFASFIYFNNPYATMIVLILGFSLRVFKVQDKYYHILNTPIYKTLFNICILSLTLISATFAHHYSLVILNNVIISYIVFCIFFIITNTFFISVLNSILLHKKLFDSFIFSIRPIAMSIFIVAPFGAILAYAYINYKWATAFFLFPIFLARYTFILYMDAKSRYVQTVDVLMRSMEARDKYTEGHSHRVAHIVEMIAAELKLNQTKMERMNIASLLHDVGKIGIDDSILNKPGNLTKDEYEAIKEHPMIGYNILKNIKDFKDISLIVKHHHERYDGKGYPEGKSFKDLGHLGLETFIIQLADSVDAMATNRPYRNALSEKEIMEELIRNRGSQFHPEVVDAYLRVLARQEAPK